MNRLDDRFVFFFTLNVDGIWTHTFDSYEPDKTQMSLVFFLFFVFQNLNILSLFLKNHKWKMLLEREKNVYLMSFRSKKKIKIKIWTKLDGLSGGERKKKEKGNEQMM